MSRAAVIDFGISGAIGITRITQTGQVPGTLEYMAPERFAGQSAAEADIYALGCVAFEAISGVSPFRRESLAETVAAHIDPRRPSLKTYSIDPVLAEVLDLPIRRSLQIEPQRRQASVTGFANELENALHSYLERQTSGARRGAKRSRRNEVAAAVEVQTVGALLQDMEVPVAIALSRTATSLGILYPSRVEVLSCLSGEVLSGITSETLAIEGWRSIAVGSRLVHTGHASGAVMTWSADQNPHQSWSRNPHVTAVESLAETSTGAIASGAFSGEIALTERGRSWHYRASEARSSVQSLATMHRRTVDDWLVVGLNDGSVIRIDESRQGRQVHHHEGRVLATFGSARMIASFGADQKLHVECPLGDGDLQLAPCQYQLAAISSMGSRLVLCGYDAEKRCINVHSVDFPVIF